MLILNDVTKHYKKNEALRGLSLTIKKGELFGLVGPNGAGKTTTLKILAGLLRNDSGSITYDNERVFQNIKLWKTRIGYVPDSFGVYDNLKVHEYLEYYGNLYGMTGHKLKARITQCLEMVKLCNYESQYVDHLSKGMKQKLCIARSLVHDPEFLLLDEPLSSLDVESRTDIKRLLTQLCIDGKTILISSHILNDLVNICSGMALLENGQVKLSGSMKDIIGRMETQRPLLIQFIEIKEEYVEFLKHNHQVKNVIIKDNEVSINFEGDDKASAELLSGLVKKGANIVSYKRVTDDIEALYLKLK